MVYRHEEQYRAIIVRGKAINDLDNLLPIYSKILLEICPCHQKNFKNEFNSRLKKYLIEASEKTLDNHRTEIVGKLFGMFFKEGEVFDISQRTLKLLEDSDQPAFFKDLCSKYQFPSGINKISPTVQEHLRDGLNIRQFSFLLKVLYELDKDNLHIGKKQVGYYVLNSKDVLTGKARYEEVVQVIKSDIKLGIQREIQTPNKEPSYIYQHINEQINLLILANCLIFKNNVLFLNKKEFPYILEISRLHNQKPLFDFSKYNLDSLEGRQEAEKNWDKYFSLLSSDIKKDALETRTDALSPNTITQNTGKTDKMLLGDEGEEYAYQIECRRIEKYFPRLKNKIKKLGNVKGLGYDIQSILGVGDTPEFAKYIEVKSTKRVTVPNEAFLDSVVLTRNEWVAAQQHKENFYIYRIYFCQNEIKVFILENPYNLKNNNIIQVIPLSYRLDFSRNSGDFYVEH